MDYDYLRGSDGSGDAALMHITAARSTGSTTISVDTVTGVPAKFIGTYGTVGSDGFVTPSTKRDFRGHINSGAIEIDGFEPGNADSGNVEGQVVVIKPNTGWANRVANFIANAAGLGSGEALTADTLTTRILNATSLTTTNDATVGGNAHITGSLDVTGTSRLVMRAVTTVDGSGYITPTSQSFSVTALDNAAMIQSPSYALADGMTGVIQIRDNGTARSISYGAQWNDDFGTNAPHTTVAGKFLYIFYRYNAANTTYPFQIMDIKQQT